MRRDSIRLVNGRLTFEDRTVGPRHDPYWRRTVELWRDGTLIWRLVSCGLAGEWIETPTSKVERREPIFADKEVEKQYHADFEASVDAITGQSSNFWLSKVWGLRDAAMWRRMTLKEREDYEAWMEADARLLSYAM